MGWSEEAREVWKLFGDGRAVSAGRRCDVRGRSKGPVGEVLSGGREEPHPTWAELPADPGARQEHPGGYWTRLEGRREVSRPLRHRAQTAARKLFEKVQPRACGHPHGPQHAPALRSPRGEHAART